MLTSVINSIAQGDPDIRIVLDLVESDPFNGWRKIAVTDAAVATPDDYAGIEILSYSRINDLRHAWAGSLRPDAGGRVHFRERIVLRVKDAARRKRGVVFRTALAIEDVDYRQPKSPYPISVRRVTAAEPGELAASLPSPSPQALVLVVRAIMQRWGQDEAEIHGRWNFDDTQLTQHLTSLPSALSNPPLKSGKTPRTDMPDPMFRSHHKYGPNETQPLSDLARRVVALRGADRNKKCPLTPAPKALICSAPSPSPS
jgi:hypothetical protein